LRDLERAAKEVTKGNYDTRVAVTSSDEVGQLSHAFNQMAQAIQQEDESKKAFLATVSHELRTPISYVKGYSESVQNGTLTGEKAEEAIHLIAREANRMERLTNELMQLVHADTEESELYPLVLAEAIRDVVHLVENKVATKGIDLQMVLDEELIIEADEEKFKQIMINLLENAIRYSNPGKAVHIITTLEEPYADIQVIDYGIGIPPEDVPKITERFYRVNKARSRADGGSGLGLSIVDQLVKQHKGLLTIKSELGKGTTVSVKLPLMEE